MKTMFMVLTLAVSVPALHAQYQVGGALGGLSTPMPTPVRMPSIAPSLTPSIVAPSAAPVPQAVPAAVTALEATPAAATAPALLQWRGQYEGGTEFFAQIITTQERWSRIWGMVNKAEPQKLDADREMAVFIEIGKRSTGGYRAAVLSATVVDGKLVVEYTDGKPSPDAYVTQAITQPWVIAIVPKSSLPVVYKNVEARP